MKSVILRMFMMVTMIFTYSSKSLSYFESKSDKGGQTQMNGIAFEKYKSFPKDWELVTVRFRHDSSELRFTYANKTAQRHLTSGSTKPYPDGSVFGKYSFKTGKDAWFTSSEVPTAVKRYQLMVKDSKRFAETGGWGYALFDDLGKTFHEDAGKKTQACFACHKIVEKKDYVFSEPAPFGFGPAPTTNKFLNQLRNVHFIWTWTDKKRLPSAISAATGFNGDGVYYLTGELQKNFFSGTLDEVVPLLISKVKESSKPAALIGDENNFSLVIPEKKSCFKIFVYSQSTLQRASSFCEN